ncbi:MAG TPA: lytic transglycosylase domain-containing protein [Thermodesulfobium narugense]|uniref:Transglycosylase SLT domain-containing protein n=1 Tax=Thermodesulfobium acidiphilum TaxID=1794699 RepID=A0A2R4VY83_THEAF|nr:lytic transglycosylase domain-containing protein [Thermodesulfobium acidiphilum]AWB09420.1 Transglycosylase SLT domain-containing protein [Thermodesulfobium acidiphilum]PMP86163.1 MAG: lytic murein transglycosylase [Thermodesulfobium narugense]HEM56064.1 lytic transglycosylase domain-containing protein [Thermodesulfobium narugense]
MKRVVQKQGLDISGLISSSGSFKEEYRTDFKKVLRETENSKSKKNLSNGSSSKFSGLISSSGAVFSSEISPTLSNVEDTNASFNKTKLKEVASSDWEKELPEIANEYGIKPSLLKAIVLAESNGNPNAVSPDGAMGLGQLMPSTARGLGVENPFDPIENLRGTAKYLSSLLKTFKSIDLALAAYNAGPGSVEKFNGVPPYAETINYIRRVKSLMVSVSV